MFTKLAKSVVSAAVAASRHNVAHAAGANLAIVGTAAIAGIVIARSLGAEGRGYYAAIMAWFALAQVLGAIGQSGAVTYWVSRDPNRGKSYVTSARVLMLVTGGLVGALGFFGSGFLANGVESVAIAYQIAFIGCLMNSLFASYVYALQAVSIKRWNTVRLFQPVAYLLLVGGFALTGILDIIWLSIALVISTLVQFTVAIRQAFVVGLTGGKTKRALLRDLARYGAAYAGSEIPASLSSEFDKLVLSRVALPAQLGEYAVATSVAGLVYPFSTAVASVVFPRSAGISLDETGRQRIERKAILVIVLVSLAVSMLIAIVGAPLIPWVFGDSFRGAIELVWWLLPAIIFRSVSQVISALLRGRRRPGLVTYGQVCGLVVGALTILPLMAWIDILGAALAVSFGEFIVLAVSFAMLSTERKRAMRHPPLE